MDEQVLVTNVTNDLNNFNISIIPPTTNQLMNNNNHILVLYIFLTLISVIIIFNIILKIKSLFCLDRNLENKLASLNSSNIENNDLPHNTKKQSKKMRKKNNRSI